MDIAVNTLFPVVEINLIVIVGWTEQQRDNIVCKVKHDSTNGGADSGPEESIKTERTDNGTEDSGREGIAGNQYCRNEPERLPNADIEQQQNG